MSDNEDKVKIKAGDAERSYLLVLSALIESLVTTGSMDRDLFGKNLSKLKENSGASVTPGMGLLIDYFGELADKANPPKEKK